MKKIVLFLVSNLFLFLVHIRNYLYDSGFLKAKKLPGLCLSIGNLALGGSGKSPFLLWLLGKLQKKGFRLAVLTRGYKSGITGSESVLIWGGELNFLKGSPRVVKPDEALMYSHIFPEVPILVSPSRFEAAQAFLEKFSPPDIWILDDGFQHRKIRRDLDIVLHDVSLGLKNQVIPGGFLREPFSSLYRCDFLVATHPFKKEGNHSSLIKSCRSLLKPGRAFSLEFENDWPVDPRTGEKLAKSGKIVTLYCGISQPEKFLKYARSLNLNLGSVIVVGDHEPLKLSHKTNLRKSEVLLTTEKDYFRDKEFFDDEVPEVYVTRYCVNEKKVKNLF